MNCVRVPVYSYKCQIGSSPKRFFTFRDIIDGRSLQKEGIIVAPIGSEVRIVDRKNPTKGAANLAVPRPGIGRFVSFNAEDAVRAARRGSFGMSWEPDLQ